jgi:murein L,D-transpeptidase YafK
MALMALAVLSGSAVQAAPLPFDRADQILVLKSERKLLLMQGGVVLHTYPIALGAQALGPKRARGDSRTPEGSYRIDARNPHSHYHLALHISYPSAADRRQSSALHADPGGDIFIHGLPEAFGHYDPDRFTNDWTKGCISVGNRAIEEIWAAVDDGTPIEIRP